MITYKVVTYISWLECTTSNVLLLYSRPKTVRSLWFIRVWCENNFESEKNVWAHNWCGDCSRLQEKKGLKYFGRRMAAIPLLTRPFYSHLYFFLHRANSRSWLKNTLKIHWKIHFKSWYILNMAADFVDHPRDKKIVQLKRYEKMKV